MDEACMGYILRTYEMNDICRSYILWRYEVDEFYMSFLITMLKKLSSRSNGFVEKLNSSQLPN
jgi:hypothetical protein